MAKYSISPEQKIHRNTNDDSPRNYFQSKNNEIKQDKL